MTRHSYWKIDPKTGSLDLRSPCSLLHSLIVALLWFFPCTGDTEPRNCSENSLETLGNGATDWSTEHEQQIVCRIRRASVGDGRSAERITERSTRLIDGNGGVGGGWRRRRGTSKKRKGRSIAERSKEEEAEQCIAHT